MKTEDGRPQRRLEQMVVRNGIASARDGDWFAVQRPDGRLSRRIFGSRLRAAEHAMRAAGVTWWPTLAERGVRVVVVTHNSELRRDEPQLSGEASAASQEQGQ